MPSSLRLSGGRRFRALAAGVVGVGVLGFVGAADTQVQRQTVIDTRAGTSAELSFVLHRRSATYDDMRIKIVRDGAVLVDERVPSPPGRIPRGSPFPPGENGVDGLRVRDLDADGEPDVQVDLFSGGANCCLYSTIFAFDTDRGAYRRSSQVWGTGYRLRDADGNGSREFITTDHRWEYLFACGACQRLPPRVLSLVDHRVEDTTRRFRRLIRRDARRQLRVIRKPDPYTYRGALASLTADRCLLGRCDAALRRVRRALARGLLNKSGRYDYRPWGRAYVRKLARVLRRFGYR